MGAWGLCLGAALGVLLTVRGAIDWSLWMGWRWRVLGGEGVLMTTVGRGSSGVEDPISSGGTGGLVHGGGGGG